MKRWSVGGREDWKSGRLEEGMEDWKSGRLKVEKFRG